MFRNVRAPAVLLLLALLGAGPVPPGPLAKLQESILYRKLPNGISVILLNRGYTPTLALVISFRAGSSDESYDTIGAAHLLEHMLFKGTDKIGTRDFIREKKLLDQIEKIGESLDRLAISNPGDKRIPGLQKQLKKLQDEAAKFVVASPYDRLYTSNGAVGFNASTSRDMTEYFVELPASKLELWARTESERLRNPVLREFYQERKTVVEERMMRYDSKGTESLFEMFIAAAFMAHPYRHPIIGWGSNVGYLSLGEVREFYRAHYTPSRMTITVVGKQNPEETLAVIEKYFGKMEGKDGSRPVAIREPLHRGERRVDLVFDANPFLLVGWNKPTYPSRDDYVCDIIAGVLADGKTSRLYRSLVLEKKIAASVDAYNGFPGSRYDNLFVIAISPMDPHTPQEVEAAVYEEISRLRNDVSPEEINRVINRTESSLILGLDSNEGLSQALSYYQTVFGDWKYLVRYLEDVRGVAAGDVAAVLDRYFTKENRTVGTLLKKEKKVVPVR